MIKSMTGFGVAEGTVGSVRVSVEIRSVNHRFFSPSLKLPPELSRWEGEVRDALRKGVARGHVTLTARVDRSESGAGRIDERRFADYLEQLRQLQQRLGTTLEVDAATVLRLPNVIASDEGGETGSAEDLVAIVDRAVAALDGMRTSEGRRMTNYVESRLDTIRSAVDRIASRAPDRLLEQRERLRVSVRELTDGVSIDEQRLAQEIAILADRLDVSEEVSRFHSHLEAFRSTLDSPSSEGVGKRLGFLLQELLREANTTGSKANDAAIQQNVISIKEELERIREQVENLE